MILTKKTDNTGMFTIVVERNREVAFQATYATRWAIGMHKVDAWIDCPTCDLSIGIKGKKSPPSDDEFVSLVHKEGWQFIPDKMIVCPECEKAIGGDNGD